MSRSALFDGHPFTLFEGRSHSGSRVLLENMGTGTGTTEGLAVGGWAESSMARCDALATEVLREAARPVEGVTPTSCRLASAKCVLSRSRQGQVPTVIVSFKRFLP